MNAQPRAPGVPECRAELDGFVEQLKSVFVCHRFAIEGTHALDPARLPVSSASDPQASSYHEAESNDWHIGAVFTELARGDGHGDLVYGRDRATNVICPPAPAFIAPILSRFRMS